MGEEFTRYSFSSSVYVIQFIERPIFEVNMNYGDKSDFLRFSRKLYENNFQGTHFHLNQLDKKLSQIFVLC